MPKVLGTVPDEVADPIMIEVFGINGHSLKVTQRGVDADATELTGIAAAKGTARGTARVLSSSDELHPLSPGDVLVCESTSPNWTPAFGKIAACVCDDGGTPSHAAIVGREYGIPTVTAVATATIRTSGPRSAFACGGPAQHRVCVAPAGDVAVGGAGDGDHRLVRVRGANVSARRQYVPRAPELSQHCTPPRSRASHPPPVLAPPHAHGDAPRGRRRLSTAIWSSTALMW